MRLVLDTNVVLDLFHWRNPVAAEILTAARNGRATLVTNSACLAELEHVIRRPEFGLEEAAVAALLGAYREVVTLSDEVTAPQPLPALPRCRDRDDQKFLELARDAAADLLVTRDKALLTLARRKYRLAGFRIVTPEAATPMLAA